MNEVLPLIGNVFMEQPDFLQLLVVVVGASFHPGELPLHPRQLFPGFCLVRRIRAAALAVHIEAG